MAEKKITQLTALASVATSDVLPIVDDPGGSPETKKVTVANLFAALTAAALPTDIRTRFVNYSIGGDTVAISTGVVKGDLMWEISGTLQSWTLLADQSGAIKIDVWKDTYANFPPTDADTICNGHEPEIAASGAKAQDTDLSDWGDTSIAAGDIWRFNVDSCTSITAVTICFKVLI